MKTYNRLLSNKSIDNSQINSNPCLKEPLLYYSNELMKCSTIFNRRTSREEWVVDKRTRILRRRYAK